MVRKDASYLFIVRMTVKNESITKYLPRLKVPPFFTYVLRIIFEDTLRSI